MTIPFYMRLLACLRALFLYLSISLPSAFADNFETLELTHYGRKRFFLLHVPKRHSSIDKWSLLIFLHGGTRTARKDAVVTGFRRVGQREGFPQDLENHWNDGRNLSTTASDQKVDDVWSM